jgi:hypothetical protein
MKEELIKAKKKLVKAKVDMTIREIKVRNHMQKEISV